MPRWWFTLCLFFSLLYSHTESDPEYVASLIAMNEQVFGPVPYCCSDICPVYTDIDKQTHVIALQ